MLVCRYLPVTLLTAATLAAAQTAPSFELIRDTTIAQARAEFNGVVAGDFNNDLQPDYIVSGGSTSRDLVLYLGNGDGTFQSPTTIGSIANSSFADMAVADVNNDGIADLVAPGADNQRDGLYVWPGKADGSFNQTPVVYAASTNGVGPVVPVDFNRDGHMDFAVQMPADEQTEIYLNDSQSGSPCATRTVSPSVTVCWPVDNTYLASGAYTMVSARACDTDTVTQMQEYVNGQLSYSADVTSFQQNYAPSAGVYNYLTKAWDNSGRDFVSDRTITAYDGSPGFTCTPSGGVGTAVICLPQGPDSSRPVQILGNGWTANAPTAAQLYIDGNLVVNNDPCNIAGNSCEGTSSVNTTQNLSKGSHDLVFRLWDDFGNVYQAQATLNVVN